MLLSPQLIASVKQGEGCRLTAYRDTLGNFTVGWGHLLAPGRNWSGYTITSDMANAMLIVDLNSAMANCLALPEWTALDTPARRDALIEIVFNMGSQKWQGFTRTRGAINAQQWQAVHDGLLQSLWATQVHGRAIKLANQMLTGAYSPLIS